MALDLLEVPADDDHHILSIQSHVVRGYVGNRACSLALQVLGHEVDVINTVDFASMYVHKGRVLAKDDFTTIYNALFEALDRQEGANSRNAEATTMKAHDLPIMMTGFTGDAEVIVEIRHLAEKLKASNCTSGLGDQLRGVVPRWKSNCLWLLDPVMGDNNALYVSPEVEATYREVYKMADIITPNEYELKWLLNNKYSLGNTEDLLLAIKECHADDGPSVVILTSCQMQNNFFSLCSVANNANEATIIVNQFPRQDIYAGGCGDCFAALLIDRLKYVATIGKHQSVEEAWRFIMQDVQSTLQKVLTMANKRQWASINIIKCRNLLRISSSQDVKQQSPPALATHAFTWNMSNVENGVSALNKIFSY